MPTGHFRIGDLSFSFEGSLKELAHCQHTLREFRRAERRLKRASESDRVVLVYDDNLEGEQGTFDKMRLRAYDDEKNYTLDIGTTDNNPLGVYVGFEQNIDVWHREKEESWELTPDGTRVQAGASSGSSTASSSSSPPQEETVAEKLLRKISGFPDGLSASEAQVDGDPLSTKLRGLAEYMDRGEEYIKRVRSVHGVKTLAELTVGRAEDAIKQIASEHVLLHAEQQSAGDEELPF